MPGTLTDSVRANTHTNILRYGVGVIIVTGIMPETSYGSPKMAFRQLIIGGVTLLGSLQLAVSSAVSNDDPRLDNGIHFYEKAYCNCRPVDEKDIELTRDGATVFPNQENEETYTCVQPSPDGKTSYRCLGVEDDVLHYDGPCLLTGKHKGV